MYPPRRLALLKPSALGDIAHTLPALTALRGAFPESEITWIVNAGFEPLLRGHPYLTRTLPFDRGAFRRGPIAAVRSSVRLIHQLRRMRFDWVIDLQGLARTGLMTAFSGAPVRIGFADAREGSRHTYTHRVRVAAGLHAVERNLALLQKIGIPVASARPHLPIDPVERTLAQEQLHPYPRPWIAVAPGAKWETKRWPPEHFAALLARWFTARGTGTAFVIGAAEDHPLAERIAQRLPQTVNLTGQTPLPRLTAILSLADLMLANDTGPLHLAAALGRPCVAPYTCTSVRRHAPYAVPGGGVETAVPCGGSYLKKCPNAYRCFEELTPDRLWPLLDQTLVWPSHSRSA